MKTKIIITILIAFASFSILLSCNSSETNQNVASQSEPKATMGTEGIPDSVYLNIGKNIAAGTQAVLGKNLVEAINKNGTEYAVQFCNVEAIPLTDSMAQVLRASVKRVTDKPRNSDNQADKAQLALMNKMKEEMKAGNTPKPQVVEMNGKMVGYYAIVTNPMCLQCHGEKNVTIEPETYKKIKALYPSDKATGYVANELRGMWVVEMDKK